MDPLALLAGLLAALAAAGYLALVTWLTAHVLRSLLGVPVGWLRTLLVSLVAMLALFPLVESVLGADRLADDVTNRPLAVALVVVVLGLWGLAAGATVLVLLEMVVPSGSIAAPQRWFTDARDAWRRGRRYAHIVSLLARHGLGPHLRGRTAPDASGPGAATTARAMRRVLEDAGVTFVKLGQMLSTRSDLLPADYVEELSRLHSTVTPLPWEEVRRVAESELGTPLASHFAHVDAEPLAAASVAQVHRARLTDGRPVVLKVQRPGAAEQVELDLQILRRLAHRLEADTSWARRLGVRDLVEGFANSLREELDYRVEIANMADLRASLDARGVRVPRVEHGLSSRRLIVMEQFDARPVSSSAELLATWTPQERAERASLLLRAVLGQIMEDGIFHADLHGGNVVLFADGTLGLLDFGSVGRLDAVSRRQLAMLLWSIDADDPASATDALLELLDRPDGLEERALQRDVGQLMTRFGKGAAGRGTAGLFAELLDLVVSHGFRIPPQIAAALRSVGALEGTLHLLDPSLDLVAEARELGGSAVGQMTPERVRAELTGHARRLLPLLDHLPRRIDSLTDDLARGRFTAHPRPLSHPDDRRFVASLVDRVVVALLAGAATIAGVLLATAQGGPELLPGVGWNLVLGGVLALAGVSLALRAVARSVVPEIDATRRTDV